MGGGGVAYLPRYPARGMRDLPHPAQSSQEAIRGPGERTWPGDVWCVPMSGPPGPSGVESPPRPREPGFGRFQGWPRDLVSSLLFFLGLSSSIAGPWGLTSLDHQAPVPTLLPLAA